MLVKKKHPMAKHILDFLQQLKSPMFLMPREAIAILGSSIMIWASDYVIPTRIYNSLD